MRTGCLAFLLLPLLLPAQQPHSPLARLIAVYLQREANGHSPTPDEIAAMATLQPAPDAASVQDALPLLLQALAHADPALRTFALTTLGGLLTPSETAAYSPDLAKALTPAIPQIATRLTDESSSNRLLAVFVLGLFAPTPPATVYPPLLTYLKRDDAINPIGMAVVFDLLQFAPVSPDTAAAITRYLRRPDQSADSRASLIEIIAGRPNQNQVVDKAVLTYLNSDDNSLRARVILSLPHLDLAPDDLADTQSRIAQLAANPSENLQVVTAARSITTCWTATRMVSGCPAYP